MIENRFGIFRTDDNFKNLKTVKDILLTHPRVDFEEVELQGLNISVLMTDYKIHVKNIVIKDGIIREI